MLSILLSSTTDAVHIDDWFNMMFWQIWIVIVIV